MILPCQTGNVSYPSGLPLSLFAFYPLVGEVLLELPESLAVTSIDAEKHELVGPIAKGVSELVGITLWLMAERAAGSSSPWSELLQTLPDSTASPILWEDQVSTQHTAAAGRQAEQAAEAVHCGWTWQDELR